MSRNIARNVLAATIFVAELGTGADILDDGTIVWQSPSTKDVVVDSLGNIYIADTGNNIIRKVDGSTGIISTVAGILSP